MVVGGAPDKNETHVKDVALGKQSRMSKDFILYFIPINNSISPFNLIDFSGS